MDAILQLRKNILADWLYRTLRKMERVLSGSVNGIMDNMHQSADGLPRPVDGLARPADSLPRLVGEMKETREREAMFLKILDEHYAIIDKICRSYSKKREDREDLYQEIVYQLWKHYRTFTGKSKLSTWIYSVALRSAVMPFRRKKSVDLEFADSLPEKQSDDPISGVDDRIFILFNDLDLMEKATMVLMMEGYTTEEIGTIMMLDRGSLNRRIHRVKNEIKHFIWKNTQL